VKRFYSAKGSSGNSKGNPEKKFSEPLVTKSNLIASGDQFTCWD